MLPRDTVWLITAAGYMPVTRLGALSIYTAEEIDGWQRYGGFRWQPASHLNGKITPVDFAEVLIPYVRLKRSRHLAPTSGAGNTLAAY